MIPTARRSSHRLETALRRCSRQSLPRPFRGYSSPSRRNEASAALATQVSTNDLYPAYLPPKQRNEGPRTELEEVDEFLSRSAKYTLLPTPLPADIASKESDAEHRYYFPEPGVIGLLAVLDACLQNCYDVRRAKEIFNNLREQRRELFQDGQRGDPVLTTKLYNRFLSTYLDMATTMDTHNRKMWLEDFWELFRDMESGPANREPAASSYAIALLAYHRFGGKSRAAIDNIDVEGQFDTAELVHQVYERQIPIPNILSDKYLTAEEARSLAKEMSRVAVELRLFKVIEEIAKLDDTPDATEVIPEALPVSSDDEVPFNIVNLRQQLASLAYGQKILQDDAMSRQKMLEASAYDEASSRLAHESRKLEELGINHSLVKDQLQAWMFEWHEKLQERLKKEIKAVQDRERLEKVSHRISGERETLRIGPFLALLEPSKLSVITILELMRLHGSGGINEGMKFARAVLTVGHAVELEYKAQVLRKNDIHVPIRRVDQRIFTEREYRKLVESRKKISDFISDNTEWLAEWVPRVRAAVGAFLVENLLEIATITRSWTNPSTGITISEEHPALLHTYEYVRGQKLGVLRLHPIVAERMSKDDVNSTLHPRHLPMLVKPKPWTGVDEGGYIYNKSSVMRLKDTVEQQQYLEEAVKRGHCELIFQGLDVLGSTPWRINRPVFDVVLKVWNSGERFVKIPPAVFDIPEPEKPDDYEVNQASKTIYHQKMQQWMTDKASTHSERCSVNYRVEIARSFLNDVFYLPHNIDFRGRAYPLPPHLNHMGDDLSRGLMRFAEARPLGKSGLRWLKIHIANLYGYDKASFDDRVRFVEERLEDIYDSAARPLEGKRWWVGADDPWQCLGACVELHNAMKSGDPEAYESSLPVHQDGTCNGLQHYAALGGDVRGAKQVNLDAGDRPSDVYTFVANRIEELVERDAAAGNPLAEMLRGKITRKVVKQTVMTTVYGVTFIGARQQIEKQLKDRGDIPLEQVWDCSTYLAKNVLGVIGDLFSGAKNIMNWLTAAARLISKSVPAERHEQILISEKKKSRLPKEQMTSVVWTTPLGLPVCQPYRKSAKKQVTTAIQTVYISDPNVQSEVNSIKQSSAFPPNFIHSLDATHMMLTALECARKGMTFASVHDSYWTHAASVDEMNRVIRETFISLHSSAILPKLREEFLTRYGNHVLPSRSLLQSASLRKLLDKTDGISITSRELSKALDESSTATVEVKDEAPSKSKRSRAKKHQISNDVAEFVECVPFSKLLPPLPTKGDFDVNIIRQSPYFFS